MKIIYFFCVCCLLVSTANGQEALRQRSTTKGLNFGLYGQYAHWNTSSRDFSLLTKGVSGPGIGLRLGYGIKQAYEVFLQGDFSVMSNANTGIDVAMGHFDAGLRFNVGSTTSRFRPLLDLAYSAVVASSDVLYYGDPGTLTLAGSGLTGGLGFNYFLSIPWAVHVRYSRVLIGSFSSNTFTSENGIGEDAIDDKMLMGTGRLSVGITYYLRGRR